jgi:hypothetical protein
MYDKIRNGRMSLHQERTIILKIYMILNALVPERRVFLSERHIDLDLIVL